MQRDDLLQYIDQYLQIDQFNDYCQNGLQVEGRQEINKISFGVSASEKLFQAAIENLADMVIVHHGLFWQKDPHPYGVTGFRKRRLALLLKHDLNLAAYHLPLDAHQEVGNNIQILHRLEIPPLEAVEVGFIGYLRRPVELAELHKSVNKQLETNAILLNFGKEFAEKVLVISGSSSFACEKAKELGVDVFIGGDIREEHVRICDELGLNFIAAGHYNTEKFGIQALAEHIHKKFKVEVQFIDIANPV